MRINITDKQVIYYSGCNYWGNNGENEFQPKNTATAMHECDDCEKLKYCVLKKETDVFEMTEEIAKKEDIEWKQMLKDEREGKFNS